MPKAIGPSSAHLIQKLNVKEVNKCCVILCSMPLTFKKTKKYVFRKKQKLTTFAKFSGFSIAGEFRGLFLCGMQPTRLQENAYLLDAKGPNRNLLLKEQGFLAVVGNVFCI
jgi:hypothetical protein